MLMIVSSSRHDAVAHFLSRRSFVILLRLPLTMTELFSYVDGRTQKNTEIRIAWRMRDDVS